MLNGLTWIGVLSEASLMQAGTSSARSYVLKSWMEAGAEKVADGRVIEFPSSGFNNTGKNADFSNYPGIFWGQICISEDSYKALRATIFFNVVHHTFPEPLTGFADQRIQKYYLLYPWFAIEVDKISSRVFGFHSLMSPWLVSIT